MQLTGGQLLGLAAATLLMGLCVALGAVGSHIIASHYPASIERFEIAVDYATLHAGGIALLVLVWPILNPWLKRCVLICFLLGLCLFSGLLLLKSIDIVVQPGTLVPIGGMAYILGWFVFGTHLAWLGMKLRRRTVAKA